MQNPCWNRRPERSTWGDWGPDDQRGRMNLITPDKRRQKCARRMRETSPRRGRSRAFSHNATSCTPP